MLTHSKVDMQSEYAAHVVFLTQIDSEASHSYPGPTYAQSLSSQVSPPPKPPKMQPYPPMPTSVVMPRMLSYAELKRRREAAAQRRVADVQEAEHEETERQVRLKHEKENFERQLAEEEQRRKLVLEEELRHAALVKKQKDELERREEEERQRLLEERRSLYHLRRIQQTQKLQEWRCERVREAEEAARRKMEMRRNVEAERRARPVPCVYASDMEVSDYFNGWVTIQTSGSLAWRRRFCRVQGSMMHMYKDAVSYYPLYRSSRFNLRHLRRLLHLRWIAWISLWCEASKSRKMDARNFRDCLIHSCSCSQMSLLAACLLTTPGKRCVFSGST